MKSNFMVAGLYVNLYKTITFPENEAWFQILQE